MLVDWAGSEVVRLAESMVSRGLVLNATFEAPFVRGAIHWNNRSLQTGVKLLADGNVESHCPCYDNRERGIICAHVIALCLTLVKRSTDPQREAKYQAEIRHAQRLAAVDESVYIRRAKPDTPGAVPAKVRVILRSGWLAAWRKGAIPVRCEFAFGEQVLPMDQVSREAVFSLSPADESLLFVLEDICEGPPSTEIILTKSDFLSVLRLLTGRTIETGDMGPVTVNAAVMNTVLKVNLNRDNGELTLAGHTELPFLSEGDPPAYLVSGKEGWVFGAANLWPLASVLPEPYHGIYDQSVSVARRSALNFLQQEMPVLSRHVRIESELTTDLFAIEPGKPKFHLKVRGSPASLAATLYARYGENLDLVAGKPDPRGRFALPDPDDLMRYTIRSPDEERKAIETLRRTGLCGDTGDALNSIVGRREVLNFMGNHIPALRRMGWHIDVEGRAGTMVEEMDMITPVVRIGDSGAGWFDVSFTFEDTAGASLSQSDIQLALQRGESFIQRGDRTLLIDGDAVHSMFDVFQDCSSEGAEEHGHFRVPSIYSGFVQSSLQSLDGVDIEDSPAWRTMASQTNRTMRIETVALPEALEKTLREYQKDGVNWLRFLEINGFNGLLADEMGLGKTVQALTWFQMDRHHPEAMGKPVLIVCPTSLVENWAEEAQRFTPGRKVLMLAGADRHDKWASLGEANMVITSYALLRRDLDQYLKVQFSVAVLDEAQHIKNRSTQNALAAKQLRAHHRLVLSGTPMENSVSDLWSIMDFLMPGYLGPHDKFKNRYESPIAKGGADADLAHLRLKRKLQPFLLRRRKSEVARDLPPKIERIASCTLSPDQRLVYNELIEASRRKLTQMVARQGFNRSRMDVLVTLMRLRQVCCHLELLKLPGLKPRFPSAKMDLFFELLDEALDSGHRILVFSQFVSMLQILKTELDQRGLTYCYLDGATKERMSVVHQFNTERSIPLFLISLKAGGTGLNLTGADMVVHFDPWWNPAVENQATDRAYRIGQKQTVYSVKLLTKDTVEEKVLALQERKKAMIKATIESDEAMMQAMTWEDVQELLSL